MNAAATIALPPHHPYISRFATDLWNTAPPTGTWRYYDGLLYMIGLSLVLEKLNTKKFFNQRSYMIRSILCISLYFYFLLVKASSRNLFMRMEKEKHRSSCE